jgi:hypothetical protein
LENLGLYGRMILTLIFNNWDRGMWLTELTCFRIGINGGLLWTR